MVLLKSYVIRTTPLPNHVWINEILLYVLDKQKNGNYANGN